VLFLYIFVYLVNKNNNLGLEGAHQTDTRCVDIELFSFLWFLVLVRLTSRSCLVESHLCGAHISATSDKTSRQHQRGNPFSIESYVFKPHRNARKRIFVYVDKHAENFLRQRWRLIDKNFSSVKNKKRCDMAILEVT
jgi:hypothetical protein